MSIGVEPMTTAIQKLIPRSMPACHGDSAGSQSSQLIQESFGMKIRRAVFLLISTVVLAALPMSASSQSLTLPADSPDTSAVATSGQLNLAYERPTQRTMASNYVFEAYGPYPIVGAAIVAGINQWTNSPPEWNQGAEGFGKRFGSDFAIAAVRTTTRYGLAEAFKEDTLYYRCECRGVLPRMSHAMISTLTSRRGEDGHRVFSFPSLVAPYAGSMTAVYGWYPDRFGAKDAFRMGNYSLLIYMGGNIALEFIHGGPHSLFQRMHLNNTHGSPEPGPNH